ncbi:glycosyltransferase [Rathayibacter iranicus]|uniref:Beta-1,4-mannosyltransferase n=2 Tax=Rathayibacter iranicus TaxID=59737 RepID=A0AAD1ADW0_9MICO|nr:glycosyltransferase [Rathayibacter iranicus]AZZ56359.1 hypothetical protein C7V51_11055 [Rathayibacter iranicus]MWV32189.1 glycosyltransferase [Rathayibacter iranicus NCPPB 2253 = VKM Ac-1602]PPI45562.1 hypothetical protein C5E09_10040 [Rathayibacter iranicus]PPI59382.1 hypothetical protein C5E08_10965 [Rathayibacter iranicus]PPI70464.1 hypothetical protein C5E01_10010 [Rathayibacter iranicus]
MSRRSPRPDSSPADLVVQQSLAPPDSTTQYVDSIVDGLAPGVEVLFFSWRSALLADYDVLHVHWPELMIRGRSPLHRFLRRRALDALLVRLALQRIPLVRTVHNLEPHELGPAAERRSLARIDRATDLFIRLNPTTVTPGATPAVTVLHGHYRDQFAEHPLPESERGRLLYFGIIRPYKGVVELIDVFRGVPDDSLSLHVVGSPSAGQRELVEERATRDSRVHTTLRRVDDAEMVDEIGRAELVVLPYREMHNSGSILVALSLSRPILVPRTPANTALAQEVGSDWVLEYDGDLTPERVTAALERIRVRPPEGLPALSGRDWDVLGRELKQAYEGAIATKKGSTR